MKPTDRIIHSVTVPAIIEGGSAAGSILPDRFVSLSRPQSTAIVGEELGAFARPIHPNATVLLQPTIVRTRT